MVNNRKRLMNAWAEWLDREWCWWGTFTFRRNVHPYSGKKIFEKFFSDVKCDATYFIVIAPNDYRYGGHIHALIGNLVDLNPWRIMKVWELRHGYARIQPYNKAKGARHYIGKHLLDSNAMFSVKFDAIKDKGAL